MAAKSIGSEGISQCPSVIHCTTEVRYNIHPQRVLVMDRVVKYKWPKQETK